MNWTGEPQLLDSYKDTIISFCQKSLKNTQASYEDVPIERYVDFWYLAMCLGVKEKKVNSKDKMVKILGMKDALTGEPNKIAMIQLISIDETGDPYIIKDSNKMIKIANEYAAGGTPLLIEMLQDTDEPIWNLHNFLKDTLPSNN